MQQFHIIKATFQKNLLGTASLAVLECPGVFFDSPNFSFENDQNSSFFNFEFEISNKMKQIHIIKVRFSKNDPAQLGVYEISAPSEKNFIVNFQFNRCSQI